MLAFSTASLEVHEDCEVDDFVARYSPEIAKVSMLKLDVQVMRRSRRWMIDVVVVHTLVLCYDETFWAVCWGCFSSRMFRKDVNSFVSHPVTPVFTVV